MEEAQELYQKTDFCCSPKKSLSKKKKNFFALKIQDNQDKQKELENLNKLMLQTMICALKIKKMETNFNNI